MFEEKKTQKKHNLVLEVDSVHKSFRIPTERVDTLRETLLNPFKGRKKNEFNVLKDINFEIKQGEFVGIIGKNGSGKSTLLKLISGIYTPDKGSIEYSGRIVPFIELGVGFNPELTARENIYLNGVILGMTRKEIKEKFDDIVEFSELKKFLDVQVKNFSSGMYVRLAFAIAIQTHGSIYILDEVLSVGDYKFQLKCLNYINKLIKQNKTIIYVSHDAASVRSYCSRVIYLRDGEVVHDGDVNEGLEKYVQDTSSEGSVQMTEEELEKGTRVTINSVKITDDKAKPRTIYTPEEDINIEIDYEVKDQTVDPLNIGIAIVRGADSRLIFGTNTKIEDIKKDLKKQKRITFKMKKIPLTEGVYDLTVAIVSYETEERYVMHDRKYSFSITRSNKTIGDILIHTDVQI